MRRIPLLAALLLLAVPAGRAAASTHVKVFLLQGEQLSAVPREIPSGAPGPRAIRALLAGPTVRERNVGYRTAFPPGTRLVRFASSSGVAVVTLRTPPPRPSAFTASLIPARGAQVAFTLRALGYEHVSLVVNGHTVSTPQSPAPPGPPPPPPVLTPGTPSPADTLLVQTQLNAMHFLPKDAVTGRWDYRTEQAVLAAQAWNGLDRDGIVGPMTLGALAQGLIPSPSVLTPGRHLEVYRSLGVTLLVQNGVTLRAVHVSSGRTPGFTTPSGIFKVVRKERYSWSVPYRVWLPYASYFHNGIAFHAYPEIPTTPDSHGCVRVSYPEAATVYAFATLGTPVYVY